MISALNTLTLSSMLPSVLVMNNILFLEVPFQRFVCSYKVYIRIGSLYPSKSVRVKMVDITYTNVTNNTVCLTSKSVTKVADKPKVISDRNFQD